MIFAGSSLHKFNFLYTHSYVVSRVRTFERKAARERKPADLPTEYKSGIIIRLAGRIYILVVLLDCYLFFEGLNKSISLHEVLLAHRITS